MSAIRHRMQVESDNSFGRTSIFVSARDGEYLPPFAVSLHSGTGSQTVYMDREEITELRDLINDVLTTTQED